MTWSGLVTEPPIDPFVSEPTAVGRVAARLGCTEGQGWSLSLGTLVVALLLSTALPDVAWRPAESAAEAAIAPPTTAPPARPAAGISPPLNPPVTTARPAPAAPVTPPTIETSPGAPTTTSTTAPEPPSSDPLHVVDGGYASSTAGTPLATTGVPAGSLAVALRVGQTDKVAFVRLGGTGTTLELALDPTPGANVLEPLAGLLLCPVLVDGWRVGDGDTRLADAPSFDCERAAIGRRGAAGDRWTFDLSGFDDPPSTDGFALVPDPAAVSPTFQVVLRRTAPEETA